MLGEGESQEARYGEQVTSTLKIPLSHQTPGGAGVAGQTSLGRGLREEGPSAWSRVYYLPLLSPFLY